MRRGLLRAVDALREVLQSICGSAKTVMSSVMTIIPSAAATAKSAVCFGPIRLNTLISTIATIAQSPGEFSASRCSEWSKPK